MTNENFVKSILALLAYREERSNGINGQLGVMFVVRNRVKAGWQGGDWLKVITGHNQFSSISIVGDSQTVVYPQLGDPNFTKLLQYVDGVFDNTMTDSLTQGALYYADLNSGGF